jgi:hypothetical protein
MFRASIRILASAGVLALAACGQQPAYDTSSPSSSSAPVASTISSAPGTVDVKLGYVVSGDDGKLGTKIGCGDSLVLLDCSVPVHGSAVESAITALLDETTDLVAAGKCRLAAGSAAESYMNPIGTKNLSVTSVNVVGNAAVVALAGQLTIAGVCESPRLTAQVEETAKANGPKDVEVRLNGDAAAWENIGNERG